MLLVPLKWLSVSKPSQYDVIIADFQSGTEGTVAITFSGMQEIIREICDNGIEDDMDGFTDCADRKCVTSPLCEKFACHVDKDVGLLPLDGSVLSAVIQTASAGDKETHTSCVKARGGQDGDVDFQVPASADVTRPLSTLQTPCCHDARKTRSRRASYGSRRPRLPPVGHHQFAQRTPDVC